MSFIANMRLATKILGTLALFGVLVMFVAGFGSLAMTQAAQRTATLTAQQAKSLMIAGQANEQFSHLHQLWLERLIETHVGKIPELRANIAGRRAELNASLTALTPLATGKDVERLAQIKAGIARYDMLVEPAERLLARNDREAVEIRVQDEGGEIYAKVSAVFRSVVEQQDRDLDDGVAAAHRDARTATMTLLGSSILGLLVVSGLSLTMVRGQVTGPLSRLSDTMGKLASGNNDVDVAGVERGDEVGEMARTVLVFRDAAVRLQQADAEKAAADAALAMVIDTVGSNLGSLAEGDLTVAITADFPGVYAGLKSNFNEALSSLRDLIGSVAATATSIQTGSQEIAQASEDLARRTEGNAASLEETSAAIQQIDARLKATANAAERSVAGSEQTMAAVGDGRERTDQAVQAMGRVSDSAKGIDSVIEGLDKIAFQTRVLAMNAAVEAGRAGDAGRGFAVVADLVSALAMRAEEEAKRARDQLTVTQAEITAAVDAVQKVDGALSQIFAAGQEATTLAQQIASDNLAQASAITEVSVAIGTMDQSTQQNAAMVEQTSAAARNLTGEVNALAEQAGRFDIGSASRRSAIKPAKLASPRATPRAAPARGGYVSPVKALPAIAAAADSWTAF